MTITMIKCDEYEHPTQLKPKWNKKSKKWTEGASKEDAEKMRQEKENPDDYTVRNKGGGHHHPNLKDTLKGQRQRRGSVMKPITMQDLVNYGNRNLIPDTKKIARKALKVASDICVFTNNNVTIEKI